MTVTEIFDWGSKISVITGLLLILVGGARKWWVFGYQLADLRTDTGAQMDREREDYQAQLDRERELTKEWKDLAERNLAVTESLLHGKRYGQTNH